MGVRDAGKNHGGTITDTTEHTNELGIDNSSARLLPAGTVCLSRGGTVGYVVMLGRQMATSQGFANWICGNELDPTFLKYLFLSEINALHRFSIGATIQTIYYPDLKAFHVCIPPLAEQQRIVGLLDEAFEGLATAKANAEKNLQNARALFESHLQSVFTQRGPEWVEKGWQTKNLGDLCDVVGGGTPPKDKPAFYSGDIPWATVRDMRQDVITETEFRITKDAVKSSATNIIPSGNVVIATRVGLGKVCLIGQDTAINQDLRGIVPRSDKALVVRYLYWWLKSIADVIVAEGTGATVQGVKLPFVKSLQIPVPPLAEQQRIVDLLDSLHEETHRLARLYERKHAALEALKKSLLHQAFTGEL